ncbi:unnamed protein product [Auanema sp. JU1783]|nr:unnamed protein product [Auanema sp. JU1783]
MGVPKFYRWLSERYPCLSEVISDAQIPAFDNLYLDMNGIIHNCSHPNDDDITFRITEEQIFNDIFAYIEKLYRIIRPQKVFFLAVDGVAPRAKMNQQRARRFMSARTDLEQLEKAKSQKQEVPLEKKFDKNCITPGTSFMDALHQKLSDWIEEKINGDPAWQGPRIYLSGYNCPGEGEHKIMDFIRTERISENYDPNTRHCMYGLDADLIMLGLVSHEPHFSLLREEVKFNPPTRKKKKEAPKRVSTNDITFHLLHLSLLREYLSWEFRSLESKLSFEYDSERIVDDWILMGFLIGNDFIPHLPNIHIHDDALPFLYETYKKVLPTLDGYINESGYLNLKRFEVFLKAVALKDKDQFVQVMDNIAFFKSKRSDNEPGYEDEELLENDEELQKFEDSDMENDSESEDPQPSSSKDLAFLSSDEEEDVKKSSSDLDIASASDLAFASTEDDPVIDEITEALALAEFKDMDEKEFENKVENIWTKAIGNDFKRHKRSYYSDKMKLKNITRDQVKRQSEGYVRAIQWILHYYYHGCVSWSWYFPHHYAPFISDVTDFSTMDMSFDMSHPFSPFEQLLAVLPESSGDSVPKVLRELMKPESTISDFYPVNFDTDLNGKKNDWEAVVLIPFIDEKRLLDAITEKIGGLTEEEKKRNTHGDHLLFQCVMKDGKKEASKTLVDKDLFRISKEKVQWGLAPGVKLDVYFPGFPTMKHIPHKAYLKSINVRVFQSNSTRPSMILEPLERPNFAKDLLEVSFDLIDKEVFIDWPILKSAKVYSIWGPEHKYQRQRYDEVTQINLTEDEKLLYSKYLINIRERLVSRYAIVADKVEAIVFVKKFLGIVYEVNDDSVVPVKQWSSDNRLIPVLLPLLVTDISTSEGRLLSPMSIEEAYPANTRAFVLDPSWKGYGFPSIVESHVQYPDGTKKTNVSSAIYEQPSFEPLLNDMKKYSLHWFKAYDAARKLGMNRKVLSRITAFIPLIDGSKSNFLVNGSYNKKVNIGLSIRSTKNSQEAFNFTKLVDGRDWLYSSPCVNLLAEYKERFPEVLDFLERQKRYEEVLFAEDIWTNAKKRTERLEALSTFLSEAITKNIGLKDSGTEYIDNVMIAHMEEIIKKTPKTVFGLKSVVNPKRLFRAELFEGKVLPDPNVEFQLFDRVVNISSSSGVPFGLQGTVIAILADTIEVLFDKQFKGAYAKGALESCATVQLSSLVNITFGKERASKTNKKKEPAQQKSPEKVEYAQRKADKAGYKQNAHPRNNDQFNNSRNYNNNPGSGRSNQDFPKHQKHKPNDWGKKHSKHDRDPRETSMKNEMKNEKPTAPVYKILKKNQEAEAVTMRQDLMNILGIPNNPPNDAADVKQPKKKKGSHSDNNERKSRENSKPAALNAPKKHSQKPTPEELTKEIKVFVEELQALGREKNPPVVDVTNTPKAVVSENKSGSDLIANLFENATSAEKKNSGMAESPTEKKNKNRNSPRHNQGNHYRSKPVQHPKLTDLKPSTVSKPIKNRPKKRLPNRPTDGSDNNKVKETPSTTEKVESKNEKNGTSLPVQEVPASTKERKPRLAARFGPN